MLRDVKCGARLARVDRAQRRAAAARSAARRAARAELAGRDRAAAVGRLASRFGVGADVDDLAGLFGAMSTRLDAEPDGDREDGDAWRAERRDQFAAAVADMRVVADDPSTSGDDRRAIVGLWRRSVAQAELEDFAGVWQLVTGEAWPLDF